MDLTLALIISLCVSTRSWVEAAHWSYEKQDEWPGMCQTGKQQSPIDIPSTDSESLTKDNLGKIKMECPESPLSGVISNSGHSVVVSFPGANSTTRPSICGGSLPNEKYYLQQFHFHWGGAEHLVNGKRYPFEAHFVNYAAKYGTFEEALKHEDGLAVLGVLYDTKAKKNKGTNSMFKRIASKLPKITKYGSKSVPIEVYLDRFFPNESQQSFFRYTGSLTTPNCDEIVTWTVFRKPMYISSQHVSQFKKVQSTEGKPMKFNYREAQPLNGRKVCYDPK